MAQPQHRVVGDLNGYKAPAKRNERRDVGNANIFLGNWGARAKDTKKGQSADQRALFDCNIQGCPCEILVLLEANSVIAEKLQEESRIANWEGRQDKPQPRRTGKAPVGNVSMRNWFQHLVVGGDQPGSILIAARMNVCAGVECVHSQAHGAKEWTPSGAKKDGEAKKTKVAQTKIMVCKFS